MSFRDPRLEREFTAHRHSRMMQQGRIAIVLGISLYLLYGLLDQWFVPPEHQARVWAIRVAALCVPVTVYLLIPTSLFARAGNLMLALVGLAAGVGFLGMFWLIPLDSLSLYYPGLVLATFFTYNLVGTRFAYALAVDLVLVIAYNLFFAFGQGWPLPVLVSHDFFIISANLIGGAAGYLQEYQQRLLFLRERELARERQEHLDRSLHDRLTGLPNRELLHDRITQALAHSARDGSSHAGYFIDLDGFKKINDEFGHEVGDRALKAVARQLVDATRETDTVSRLGGDEFFVLVFGVGVGADATRQADRMLAAIKAADPAFPPNCALSASIGICLIPSHAGTVSDIISRADQAMYRAKKAGKNRHAVAGELLPEGKLRARAGDGERVAVATGFDSRIDPAKGARSSGLAGPV